MESDSLASFLSVLIKTKYFQNINTVTRTVCCTVQVYLHTDISQISTSLGGLLDN